MTHLFLFFFFFFSFFFSLFVGARWVDGLTQNGGGGEVMPSYGLAPPTPMPAAAAAAAAATYEDVARAHVATHHGGNGDVAAKPAWTLRRFMSVSERKQHGLVSKDNLALACIHRCFRSTLLGYSLFGIPQKLQVADGLARDLATAELAACEDTACWSDKSDDDDAMNGGQFDDSRFVDNTAPIPVTIRLTALDKVDEEEEESDDDDECDECEGEYLLSEDDDDDDVDEGNDGAMSPENWRDAFIAHSNGGLSPTVGFLEPQCAVKAPLSFSNFLGCLFDSRPHPSLTTAEYSKTTTMTTMTMMMITKAMTIYLRTRPAGVSTFAPRRRHYCRGRSRSRP
jgi:hypothetical protein